MTTATQSGMIQAGDHQLYYEITGAGEPLILAHAGFVDSRMWDPQWDALQQHFRVIRYDLAGFGKSEKVTGPIARREELLALMQALNIQQAHLVGCSLSGATIVDFALDHPHMVSSLTLVSTVPNGFDLQGPPPPNMIEMITAMQQGDIELTSELQVRIWLDGATRQSDEVDSELRQKVKVMNEIAVANGTFAIADMQPLRPLDPPAITRLQEITQPTLIIVGELDHPEMKRAAEMMSNDIDGQTQQLILENSTHLPNMEQASAFNQALLSFLNVTP